MKIGLLSYHNSVNYGAVLQIYALKKTLEKLGADVSVIDYKAINSEYEFSLDNVIRHIGLSRALVKYLYYHTFAKKLINAKKRKFTEFINVNFNLTRSFNSTDEFGSGNNYDIVICGSDQIWNPEITNGFDRMMFCDFYSTKTQKFSYAASVGDVKIIDTEEKRKEFFKLLKNFNSIAVREKELADFISQNSKINTLVTLDPTLLLNASEYTPIKDAPKSIDRYILVYQLARYPRSMEVAHLLAKEKNLKIIEIINNPYVLLRDKSMLFSASPLEFLNLVQNAEYVITNSFHGTIFSIIFKKDFYTVASRTRNSRITNLLTTLNLTNRLLYEDSEILPRNSIDYDKVGVLLEKEREISLNYLKDIVNKRKNE
jgi:hypothetical protein